MLGCQKDGSNIDVPTEVTKFVRRQVFTGHFLEIKATSVSGYR